MAQHEEEIIGKAYDSRLMRRLLTYLHPYRWQVVLAVIVLILGSLAELLLPWLTRVAIDRYISTRQFRGLLGLAAIYFAVLLVQMTFIFFQTFLTQKIGQKVMYDMRNQIFSHLQRLPLSFFDKNPVGRLVTRATNDVETLNSMLSSGVVTIFGDLFVLFGIIIVMLIFNWQLALLSFTVLPLIFAASAWFRINVRESFRKVRLRIARINSYLQENIMGMSIVQIFNREKKNHRRFDQLNHDYLEAYLETIYYYSVLYPVVEIISALALAIILWYGGIRVISGALTIGVVVAFVQYSQRFFQPIRDLSEKYNLMQAAMASSERIFKLLDEAEQAPIPEHPAAMPPPCGEIEFREVTFSYNPDEPVLKRVTFKIGCGQKVAIVGATGAGKTTLINLIDRLYEPSSGQILLNGIDTALYPLPELRRRVRMVLQDVFIFSGTVEYNIRLGDQSIPMERVIQAARDVHAHEFIEKLPNGYQTELSERGSNLSVGQKQLLSFARALVFDPEVLIMDEATSSVDTETELLLREATTRLMTGRTSVIIAHRLSTIQNVDWILVLHKGEVREMGTHAELLARKGIYHRLYQLQYQN